MAKTILSTSHARLAGTNGQTTAGATEFWFLGHAPAEKNATETNRHITYHTAGTVSKLYVRVITNTTSANSTVTVRQNGADTSLTCTITAGTTGQFEDTNAAHNVTVADGDELCYKTVSGGTGTFIFSIMRVIFDATTNCVTRLVSKGYAVSTAATNFIAIAGDRSGVTGTESNTESTLKRSCTLKNGFINVTANARTDTTTFTLRKNRADTAIVITYTSGQTGIKEDTANSISYTTDDELDWEITTTSGTATLTFQCAAIDISTTTDNGILTSGAVGSSSEVLVTEPVTWFFPIGGGIPTAITTESQAQQKAGEAFLFRDLITNITANGITGTSTLRLRVNGADSALTTPITTGQTGFISDTTHTVTVADTDLICLAITTPAITGTPSMSVRQLSITTELAGLTRVTQDIILKYNIVGRITQNFIVKYNIIGRIVQNFIVKYNILVRIIQSLILKYNIIGRIVQNLIVKYNIIGRITQNLILKYNIQGRIINNLIVKYNIVERIVQNLIIKYNIVGRIVQNFIAKYNIIGRITQNLILKYNIIQRITQDIILKYNILNFVTQNLILKYNIQGRITNNLIVKYGILNRIVQSLIVKYNIVGRIVNDLIIKYDIFVLEELERVTNDLIIKYNITGRIVNDFIAKYNIIGRITQNFITKYNISERITQNLIAKYNIAQRVIQNLIVKYNIFTRVSNNLIVKYDILTRTVQNLIAKYNITGRVSNDFIAKYNLRERVTQNFTVNYSILMRAVNDLIIKYDLLERISNSIIVKYGIFTRVVNDFTVNYNILSLLHRVTNAFTVRYKILRRPNRRITRAFAEFPRKTRRAMFRLR